MAEVLYTPNLAAPMVHNVGGGKAAFALHGPNWLLEGFNINVIDPNPEALTVYKKNVPGSMVEAHEAGRVTFQKIGELAVTPNIIDITAASGHHVSAVQQTLEQLEEHEKSGAELTWLIEKPVTSSESETDQLLALFRDGSLNPDRIFVNENYNASAGVERAREIIAAQAAQDVTVVTVDVVFNKNRKPDVDNGRFTDPILRSFGIEMPHMVAVAYNLAGIDAGEQTEIVANVHHNDVHGVRNSHGSYTVVRGIANGVMVRMAQGLGPYRMSANGDTTPCEDQPVERHSTVTLSDGRQIMIEFDPVAGIDRYTSRVTWQDAEGKERTEVIPDNTLRSVIGGVASFALSGKKPSFAAGINVPNALAYAQAVAAFAQNAC